MGISKYHIIWSNTRKTLKLAVYMDNFMTDNQSLPKLLNGTAAFTAYSLDFTTQNFVHSCKKLCYGCVFYSFPFTPCKIGKRFYLTVYSHEN